MPGVATFEGHANVVGFGRGSLDVILPPEPVGTDYIAGGTDFLRWEDELRLKTLSDTPGHERLLHVGGDVINVLAWAALQERVKTSFMGVLGSDDPASNAIRTELGRFGIQDNSVIDGTFKPGTHLIIRSEEPGSDRMVRRNPATPKYELLSDSDLKSALKIADLVFIASVSSPELTRRIFRLAPDSEKISYNPGSSRFSPDSEVIPVMRERKPALFAASIEELRALFAKPDERVEDLALRAGRYATNVLVTLGGQGLLLANNGQIARQACTRLRRGMIVDKLGAGDRSHAECAIRRILHNEAPDLVLKSVDRSATQVIQYDGGHGDLYSHVRPVTFSLRQIAA